MGTNVEHFYTSSMTGSQAHSFTNETIAIIRGLPDIDPVFITYCDKLDADLATHNLAQTRDLRDVYTEKLNDAEALRVEAFGFLMGGIQNGLKARDPLLKQAANILWVIAKKHTTSLLNLSRAEEGAMIEAILSEYDFPENTALLTQLNFIDRLEALRKDNADYLALEREKQDHNLAKENLPYKTHATNRLIANCNTVIRALFYLYENTTDKAYLDGFNKIRNISVVLATTARIRETDAKNAEKKSHPPSPIPSLVSPKIEL